MPEKIFFFANKQMNSFQINLLMTQKFREIFFKLIFDTILLENTRL